MRSARSPVGRPEEILDLRRGDQQGDAVGEADGHRPRNELDGRAQPGESHHTSMPPAIKVTSARPDTPNFATMPATITTNAPVGPPICSASAERRDQTAGDNGRVDAGLWRYPRRDGKGHGQRQRHQAHRYTGEQVQAEVMFVVAAETEHRLW